MTTSILVDKSYTLALRIVRLSQQLNDSKKEFILSRKVLDSRTAIAALVEEARQGEDRSDFSLRLGLAVKEAFETNYWLRLLRDSDHITGEQASSMLADCLELQKMLIASRKTTRNAS